MADTEAKLLAKKKELLEKNKNELKDLKQSLTQKKLD